MATDTNSTPPACDGSLRSHLVDLHQHLLDMLGAKDHADAGRIIGELQGMGMDRARETPRRQSAVELLLSLGYVWRTDRWEAPQHAVAPDRIAIKMLVAAGFVSEDKANESLRIAHGFGGDLGQPAPAAVPVDLSKFRDAVIHAYVLATDARFESQLGELLDLIDTHPQPAAAGGDA
ncbi:hypothetical protein VC253_07650 [Xanthomonas campestris]|uniref:hypothetical protein n=1 Tax=Xanthomonas campestris TaxID=339 RepID=UPI002B22A923|nr:hypothetical protein [Xanthomonas campestris]MEB1653817.1 hypothetical protein [Xanthomonas campestris pv. campestris]MEA9551697.1 hypothetical protein [Xanthomonas campestris]MEB1863600.1 hypothetical protein [Xanthomonas campestris pv. campestris]MEB1892147.1 hypothetical protein [Xanthomonas campestris pv. campestris]MEB2012551.1 hypothetical protein [Xanthomonas campestris pv. campestris]